MRYEKNIKYTEINTNKSTHGEMRQCDKTDPENCKNCRTAHRWTNGHKYRQTNTQTDRQTNKQTVKQTDSQTNRQTDRQTDSQLWSCVEMCNSRPNSDMSGLLDVARTLLTAAFVCNVQHIS